MQPTPRQAIRDEYDERWARWMRDDFGRKGWILSWEPLDGGGWRARLSCAEWPETVEMEGRSRCHAIGRAHRALELILTSARRLARRARDVP